MMDINLIKSVDRAELPILHPVTREKTGAFITLASPDHPARKQAVTAVSRRLREAGEQQDNEMLEELTDAAVASSVLGWRGVKVDGVELPFSTDAARDLLGKPEMKWLRSQIAIQLARQENFIETSAPG